MANRVPLTALHPADWNPRLIKSDRFKNLCRSIEADPDFLRLRPILAMSDGSIYAGNMRYRAAEHLKRAEVWAEIEDVPEQLAKERALRDNQQWGEWQEDELAELLAGLKEAGSALDILGFEQDEVERLLSLSGADGELHDDDADLTPPVDPITKPGDLWLLGDHRLLCGDATKADDVERVMNGERADLCLTDPPYGLGQTISGKNEYAVFEDTKEAVASMALEWLPIMRQHAPTVVFTCGVTRMWLYPEAEWLLCWFYGGGQFRSQWGFNCWQPFLCYGPDPSLANGHGCRPDAVDMNTPANRDDLDHPCPKPLALWVWMFERLTFKRGELVLDPFVGAGTGVIAAEQLDRRCYGLELDPRYCDVTIRRWETVTGRKAERG